MEQIPGRIKVLFLASNPQDTSQLALNEEIREVDHKIRAAKYRDSIDLVPALAARPDDLLQAMNEYKPQIVHFSGHGEKTGELLLIDDFGKSNPVSTKAIKSLFTTLKDNIRVVFLNACYAKLQAEAITEVIDCAIGMNKEIGDEAAIAFSASFYRAIGFGRSVKEAFDQGIIALLLKNIPENNTPELLTKKGVDPSEIYLLKPNNQKADGILADIDETDKHKEPSYGNLINVPELPPSFLQRPEYLKPIKDSLLSDVNQKIGITSLQRVGIQGMGGIGKSVLAAAIARDEDIRKTFRAGVIWVNIGQKPDLITCQLQIAKALSEEQFTIRDAHKDGKDCLRKLLVDKACLIILDDVWDDKHAEAFDVAEGSNKLLITSRKAEILKLLDAKDHPLGLLSYDESKTLLAARSGQNPNTLPKDIVDNVVKECGYLPLALAMVGSMARGKPDIWENILYRLKTADLGKIRRLFKGYEHDTLLKAIEISVDDLEPENRERYLDLAVFSEDAQIPLAVLQTYWEPEGLNQYDTQDLIYIYVDRSLAQMDKERRIRLHDLQLDYIRSKMGDLKGLNIKLVDAYLEKCEVDWTSGPDDGYFFEHLAYHLFCAGRHDELQELLLDPKWLKTKLKATNSNALISDYDLLDDADLQLVQGAIRLSAHVIENDKSQLASQLTGRLIGFQSPHIRAMLEKLHLLEIDPWLCPLTPSLTPPGGPLLRILEGHVDSVAAVAVTPDGKRAVSGSCDRAIMVWDLESGRELRTLGGHVASVVSVAVTPDGKRAVSGSGDGLLKVWDLESGRELRTLGGHVASVVSVAVTPDGKRAVSGSRDATLKVWDLESGRELRTLEGHTNWIEAVAVTPDGKSAVSGSYDMTLKIWDLESGRELRTLEGHIDSITSVAVTPDGKSAVSGSFDGLLKIWDLESGRELRTFEGHTNLVTAVAVTPDGKRAVSGSFDNTLKVWDLESGRELRTLEGHTEQITSVAVTPDGKRAVSGSCDNTLKVWDLESGRELRIPKGHINLVEAVAVTPDGKSAVSGSYDTTLKVWDLESGRELRTLEGHTNLVTAVAMTPDGKMAVSGSLGGLLKVWDLESGRELGTLEGHTNLVEAVAVTPDGKRAVSGSFDATLKVWDLESGKEIAAFGGDASFFTCNFSSDSQIIVAGDHAGNLHFLQLVGA